jgi:hypothetical protein
MKSRMILTFVILALAAHAQEREGPKLQYRYGFSFNDAYSQKTPQETMRSIVKAFDNNRYDYFAAQLIDPEFVDSKVRELKKEFPTVKEESKTLLAFDRVLKQIREHFRDDPVLEREIRFFARETAVKDVPAPVWEIAGDSAVGTWKGSPRKIHMKRIEDRWFMENRQR